MSWQDKIQNSMVITAGTGNVFTFNLWVNPIQELEWNATEFDFINTSGTDVVKKKVKGRKFPLEFYLQGADHLDEADRFRIALNDERPCIIDHPYYGRVTVQILSLKIDNTTLNISKFTGVACETGLPGASIKKVTTAGAMDAVKVELDEACEVDLPEDLTATEVNVIQNSVEQDYKSGLKIAGLPQEAQAFQNAFNQASNAIDVITATPLNAIRSTLAMLQLPAHFAATVKARLQTLKDQFDYLRRTLLGLATKPAKKMYEVQGLGIVSSMAIAAINPQPGNYTNSTSVLAVMETIQEAHAQLISDLDSLQSTNANSPEAYVPDFQSIKLFNDLISLTLSNLLAIALNGKKEITVVLTEDSNIILLTDKYYGLDANDNNIQKFVDTNGLTYKDTLIMRKGRSIVYYV